MKKIKLKLGRSSGLTYFRIVHKKGEADGTFYDVLLDKVVHGRHSYGHVWEISWRLGKWPSIVSCEFHGPLALSQFARMSETRNIEIATNSKK